MPFFFFLLHCGLVPCSFPCCNVSLVTQILPPPLSLSLLMGRMHSFAAPFLEEKRNAPLLRKKSLSPLLLLLPRQVYASPTLISAEATRKELQCRLLKCLELFSQRGSGLVRTAGSSCLWRRKKPLGAKSHWFWHFLPQK